MTSLHNGEGNSAEASDPGDGRSGHESSQAYDSGRNLERKEFYSACYAPSGSMYFDQFGKVRACCQNTGGLLGDVTRQSIREIWESVSANRLREALAVRDFSVGCGFCAWQVEEVGCSEFARGFDDLNPSSIAPRWPERMEFSMTNSCNLQCVMCNGDWSSSIRVHREGRAPLPEVYGEAFFEELAVFLPHLEEARFLGGEPFLGKEPLRVLEMLAGLDDPPRVSITTNGTQWSPRIEAICERVPISFVVSLDGITKETYESIRVGADFDVVMANLVRFREYARRHGTSVSIAHCLMVPNYREFLDLLVWAEDFGIDHVGINTVLFPSDLSLYQLDGGGLAEVLVDLTVQQDSGRVGQLEKLRPVWDAQLLALASRFRESQEQSAAVGLDPWADATPTTGRPSLPDPWSQLPLVRPSEPAASSERVSAPGWVLTIRCKNGRSEGPDGEVVRPVLEVDDAFRTLLPESAEVVVGQPISVLPDLLSSRFGAFVGEPITDEAGVTATFEGDSGEWFEASAVFIDEGPTIRIVVTVRPSDG